MDIEQFYEADPRRQSSEEVQFGREWTDTVGNRYEISWIAATGEVYAMFEPVEPMASDGIGDVFVQKMPTSAVTVEVLGVVESRDDIDQRLAGWADVMPEKGSVAWIRERFPA